MKSVFMALALLLSVSAFADSDPFDPNSCTGPMISAQRALELLGNSSSVALAKNKDGILNSAARMRQKLGGAVGKWFSTTERLVPTMGYIGNNGGKLSVAFYYGYARAMTPMSCELSRGGDTFTCQQNPNGGDRIGSGTFYVRITDHCVRMTSVEATDARDYEWVYSAEF